MGKAKRDRTRNRLLWEQNQLLAGHAPTAPPVAAPRAAIPWWTWAIGAGVLTVALVVGILSRSDGVRGGTAPPDDRRVATAEWANTHSSTIERLTVSVQDIGHAAEGTSAAVLGNACRRLAGAVVEAEANPPVPDPAVERDWRRALDGLGDVAELCSRGARTDSQADIDSAARALDRASIPLGRAVAAITGD